jgi:hypothetical protein
MKTSILTRSIPDGTAFPYISRLAADRFQIKNAVAAHALITKHEAPLAYSHLQQAVKTS